MAKTTNTAALAESTAALAVLESLLLALTEMGVLNVTEVNAILADAAAAKRATPSEHSHADTERAASIIIEQLLFDRAAFGGSMRPADRKSSNR